MSIPSNRQPEAGALVAAHRQALGLRVQDFCDLVSAQSTRYGKVNLDRTGLWRIEAEGLVPLPPRRWAIALVLGTTPGAIWTTPGHRLVDQIVSSHRKAAA